MVPIRYSLQMADEQVIFEQTLAAIEAEVRGFGSYTDIRTSKDVEVHRLMLSKKLDNAKLQVKRRSEHREWKHCSWHFSSSSLFQTWFIVFVTYLLYLKHPNKSFLTQYIYLTLLHTLLLFFNILFRLTSKYFYIFVKNLDTQMVSVTINVF